MDRLEQTYDDPNSFLEGPEYQATQRTVANELQRSDAARGMNANSLPREQKLQDYAMRSMANYRQGLQTAGSNLAAIATGSGNVNNIMSQNSQYAPLYDLWGGLSGKKETKGK